MSGSQGKSRMAEKEKSPRQRAWQAMRILPRWTLGDIESCAEIGRSNIDKYLAALLAARYVRCIEPRKSGVKGGYAVFRLIRNTGPRCPVTKNYGSVIRDSNTGDCITIGKPKRAQKQVNNKPNRITKAYQHHAEAGEGNHHVD